MSTISELFTSLRSDLAARYRSPILGTAVIALVLTHWKIAIYLLSERHPSLDAIAFIEANFSRESLAGAMASALGYAVLFPWVEHLIDQAAGHGKRRRNEFQAREREREVRRKKLIAQEMEQMLGLELQNKDTQSVLADIDLAKAYQGILSGENFSRWLVDLEQGPVNSNLNNTIVNYLHRVDAAEGKFISPEIEAAHAAFVKDLSTLLSALNDSRAGTVEEQRALVVRFSQQAQASQKRYRELVRSILRI